jgi:hypothetical protein
LPGTLGCISGLQRMLLLIVCGVRRETRMRKLATPIEVSGAVLGLALFLTLSGAGQVKNNAPQTQSLGGITTEPPPADVPPCNGASGSSHGHSHSQGRQHSHSVTLSWKAAVPKSNSPQDSIKGYYVYRSLTSQKYAESNRISELPVQGTRCVDATIEPRKTYFYVVKAVTEGGEQSNSSIEIKAVVPFP